MLNFAASTVNLNDSSAGTNQTTVNLNGGSLTVGAFTKGNVGPTQLSTLNLNGGILRAGTSNPAFLPSLVGLSALVQAAGAKIDTNGFDITVAQPLIHDPSILGADGGLQKRGEGVLTLSGESTFTGPTSAEAGTLLVSGKLSGTSQVAITSATFELGAADRLKDSAILALNNGSTFSTRGFSETLGAVTLAGAANLDLGTGASVLHFADSSSSIWNPGTLTIAGWTGSANGGGTDQLFFGINTSGLTAAQLAQIRFTDPAGFGPGLYPGRMLANGELVAAIPEPASTALLFAGISCLLGIRRRAA